MPVLRPQVFMSHAREDAKVVHKLAADLRSAGIEAWVDTTALDTGDRIDEILLAIKESTLFFAFITDHFLASKWCKRELDFARSMPQLLVAPYADSETTREAIPEDVLGDVVCGLFRDVSYQKKVMQIVVKAYDSLQVASRVVPAANHILASPEVFDTRGYSRADLIARTKRELVLAGNNLRNWLTDEATRNGLVELATAGKKVTLILATYETLRPVSEEGAIHLRASATEIRDMMAQLPAAVARQLTAHFHLGASTLSAVFVDPTEADGILVFSPRWAIQTVPNDRFSCVIDKRINDGALYRALYGGITLMIQRDAKSVEEMLDV